MQKTISVIDYELELLNLKIQHPEQFYQSNLPIVEFDLYFVPKRKGLGIVALAEIAIALFLSKQIIGRNGKPADLIQIANAFERVFNLKFGSIYDQQEHIYNRKPFNRTKALDFLCNLLIRNNKSNKQNEK